MPLTCSDDDPDVFEVLRRAGIKLDDAPREVFAPDVLRRAGEDDVDPRVTRAVDALTARLFPEAEDGKEPSWWRPDQSFWICEPTKPKESEERPRTRPRTNASHSTTTTRRTTGTSAWVPPCETSPPSETRTHGKTVSLFLFPYGQLVC